MLIFILWISNKSSPRHWAFSLLKNGRIWISYSWRIKPNKEIVTELWLFLIKCLLDTWQKNTSALAFTCKNNLKVYETKNHDKQTYSFTKISNCLHLKRGLHNAPGGV
ncbi:MAG: hypothetical protein MRERV_7c002 [Mycoplasmataceae bacterium RV_VA103A]|nr:MAG: hypothetical protein MRERV_7c002 [Mycoplasmataceae bacterium RV_VA103A]